MGYLTISTNVRRYQTHHRWHFSFRKTARWCTRIVHTTQSNCCGSLDFLSSEPCPPTAPSWAHWLQNLGSHTVAWVWVLSQKDWRNQGATGWLLAMHWFSIWVKKMWFSCFSVLSGSAEAQVISGGKEKRLLIAYFISNISAKKYQNAFTYVKVIANQRWDVFWKALYNTLLLK